MCLGSLKLKYYPYGVYQKGTIPYDTKIPLFQRSLDIYDSPFDSYEIFTLDLLLHSQETPINTIIMDDPIYNIPFIPQVL